MAVHGQEKNAGMAKKYLGGCFGPLYIGSVFEIMAPGISQKSLADPNRD
jgi:hypothetical protein